MAVASSSSVPLDSSKKSAAEGGGVGFSFRPDVGGEKVNALGALSLEGLRMKDSAAAALARERSFAVKDDKEEREGGGVDTAEAAAVVAAAAAAAGDSAEGEDSAIGGTASGDSLPLLPSSKVMALPSATEGTLDFIAEEVEASGDLDFP